MTIPIDTSPIVRHFTGDPPLQAQRATHFIRSARVKDLLLLDLHVAECVFVLEGPYRQSRAHVTQLMRSLMGVPSIQFEREPTVARALDLYSRHRFDYPDAYLVAAAEAGGYAEIASFDRFDTRLSRASRVRRIEPR